MNEKDFEIKFSGLELGQHQFDFQLNNKFFDHFDYQGLEKSDLKVDVMLLRKQNSLELTFALKGTAIMPCDVTNEEFALKLKNELDLLVKFGEEYDDSDADILVLPKGAHSLNISQYLYELAVLSVPLKKVHPEVQNGNRGAEVLKKLEELSPGKETGDNKEIDPRWDKLKSLLN